MGNRLLQSGEELKVGDVILATFRGLGSNNITVTRVTKNYCFAKLNENYEAKYPIKYHEYYFESFPRQKWKTTEYKVYRRVDGKQEETKG